MRMLDEWGVGGMDGMGSGSGGSVPMNDMSQKGRNGMSHNCNSGVRKWVKMEVKNRSEIDVGRVYFGVYGISKKWLFSGKFS